MISLRTKQIKNKQFARRKQLLKYIAEKWNLNM